MAKGYAKDQPAGFTNRIERVAIVGAGGNVGRHVAEHLLKTGKHVVTALTRADSTNKLPPGVKAAQVDYNNESTLVSALQGQQFLIISLAVTVPPDTHSKLVRAAAAAGVPYVMPNWWGGDLDNEELGRDTRLGIGGRKNVGEIEELGVSSWVALACGFWYEFSLAGGSRRYGFDFHDRTLVLFDDGRTPINTSTWPQCGRAVAALLSLKELPDDESDDSPTLARFRNRCVFISSFRVSQRDMFESVKRVTGTTDADWKVTSEPSAKRYADGCAEAEGKVGAGDRVARTRGFAKLLYSRVFYPNGDGDFETRHGLDNEVLGLPKEDLDEATREAVRMAENNEVPY
ncbi:hypothetical protein VTK73DRAFT_9303 [Phialemonium thermophilum]|uniref:NAD(P)-binding domain-containing protein n=1 Tax=Phialemonium thermophilum TaxID=223376 RepID=A0ABR3XKD6_9PEZI